MAVAHTVAQHIPFNPVLIVSDPVAALVDRRVLSLSTGFPSSSGGLFVGVCFTAFSSRMHQLYFWNMLGSGIGRPCHPWAHVPLSPGLPHLPPRRDCSHPGPAFQRAMEPAGRTSRVSMPLKPCLTVAIAGMSYALLLSFGQLFVSDFKPVSYARKVPRLAPGVLLVQSPGRDAGIRELLFPFCSRAERHGERFPCPDAPECFSGALRRRRRPGGRHATSFAPGRRVHRLPSHVGAVPRP